MDRWLRIKESDMQEIANAVKSKTGATTISGSAIASTIENELSAGGGGGSSGNTLKTLLDATKSCHYLFSSYTGTSVDGLIQYSDTENVTNMGYMFRKCTNLQTIPQLNTSNVTNMSAMFYNSKSLTTISQLNTSRVILMTNMFSECYNLQTIDITSLDKISGSYYVDGFAYNCYSLTKVIIRTMTQLPPLNTNSFTNCYHFTGTTNSNYNPEGLKDGRIYVPDAYVDQLKSATNWSTYADIIVPLSTLVE